MCFNQPISAGFAVIMWTYAIMWKKGPIEARSCIAFFAAMETLQSVQYSWIDMCDDPVNKFLTFLGFLHLAFQPLFTNLYLTAFMTKAQKRYAPLILALCAFSGVLMTNRLWKTFGDVPCSNNIEPMCGPVTCTFKGNVHLAWQMPMQHADQDYFTPGFQLHFFTFYLPTFALGMWPFTLFLLASGPFLGRVLTNHQDEIPAIWCFFSIFQLLFPLAHAYVNKTAMFKPAQELSLQDQAALAIKEAKAEEADPVGGWRGILYRSVLLAAALTLKRFAVLTFQKAQMPGGILPPPIVQ